MIREAEQFFKKGSIEMDKVCLQFSLYSDSVQSEVVLISPTILNSKRFSLDIIPGGISAQKACCDRERTIYLRSKFKLKK